MHRYAVAHRTGHQLLSVSIAFQCLGWMVDCISNHKIIHSLYAVMQDCCCQSCIISYFCVAPIFNDVVPRSVPQFPNSSPEMHLSSLSTVLMLSLRLAKKGIESMLLRRLKRHWLLNELRRCCRRAFIVMKICFHFFFPAQALRRKWPIMLAAILGLFLTFLCLTLSSVHVQSHPLKLGWWLCSCVSVCIWQSRRGMGSEFWCVWLH